MSEAYELEDNASEVDCEAEDCSHPASESVADRAKRSSAAKRPRGRKGSKSKRQSRVSMCTFDCQYDVVKEAAKAGGYRLVPNEDDRCNIYWIDMSSIQDRFSKIEPWQRINHFPGMSNISRKNRLAQNLGKMRRKFPKEYSFYPRTWVLPNDASDFRAQFDSEGQSRQVFIVKPDNSSKGRGIFLTQDLDKVALNEPLVAQTYVMRPLLLDGYKFDIRMYCLITSCSPLRIYQYTDGLVRLCTEEYIRPNSSNIDERCMHLTNYAVNRFSENYERGEDNDDCDTGSKRSLKWFMSWVRKHHGEAKASKLWEKMGSLVVKTVISILPTLVRDYRAIFGHQAQPGQEKPVRIETEAGEVVVQPVRGSRSFEILGVDIMVDQNLKPWLLEVNTLSSFATDGKVDYLVKKPLLEQTLSIIKATPSDQRNFTLIRKRESEERLLRTKVRSESHSNNLQDEANVVVRCRRRIEEVFHRYAPKRLDSVDDLMKKYKGREASLLSSVLRRCRPKGDEPVTTADTDERASTPTSTCTPLEFAPCTPQPPPAPPRPVMRDQATSPSIPLELEQELPMEQPLAEPPTVIPPASTDEGSCLHEPSTARQAGGDDEGQQLLATVTSSSKDRMKQKKETQDEEQGQQGGLGERCEDAGDDDPSSEPEPETGESKEDDDEPPVEVKRDVIGALAAEIEAAGEKTEGSIGDEDLCAEEKLLSSFQRIYPVPTGARRDNYQAMIAYVTELEHKLLKGGSAALATSIQVPRRRRDSEPADTSSEPLLPPLSHRKSDDGDTGGSFRTPTRPGRIRAFDGSSPMLRKRHSAPVIVLDALSQARAAERLMCGFSSTAEQPPVEQQQDGSKDIVMVGKLRVNQIRARERRRELTMRVTKPLFEPIKAHTLELNAPPPGLDPVFDWPYLSGLVVSGRGDVWVGNGPLNSGNSNRSTSSNAPKPTQNQRRPSYVSAAPLSRMEVDNGSSRTAKIQMPPGPGFGLFNKLSR